MARDVFDTSAAHFITDTECLKLNASTHGRGFATFKCQCLTKDQKSNVNLLQALCVDILTLPIVLVVILPLVPLK